jgi:hypothetical protein
VGHKDLPHFEGPILGNLGEGLSTGDFEREFERVCRRGASHSVGAL